MKIVLICIDCLRKDAVKPESEIGKFIAENLEFTEAYASAPSTIPSVVTCLSGQVTGEHGSITTAAPLRTETWVQGLRERGFHTVCYTENNFFRSLQSSFDEWVPLPWMKDRDKWTSPNYDQVWRRIRREKRDSFFYVHLMDVHPPYRFYPPITPEMFPKRMWAYELVTWVNETAAKQQKNLSDEEFGYLWKLMEGEVETVNSKIQFPGDLVFVMADHGELVGDWYDGGRWWSHAAKHFTEQQLRIPLAAKGLGVNGTYDRPFMTRFLGEMIFATLDETSWPDGSELYWEDYWYDVATFATCHDGHYLSMSSTGEVVLDAERVDMDDVPPGVYRSLVESMVRHNNHQHLYSSSPPFIPDEAKIIEERLRGLGYIE